MRSVGAVEASWTADGALLSLKLGAEPSPPNEEEDGPVKRRSADAQAEYERQERRRISMGASGGPVRRVNAG